jgi:hypothetical protein
MGATGGLDVVDARVEVVEVADALEGWCVVIGREVF